MTAAPLEVRHLTAADKPAMLALFKAVFGHEMSEALHAWKYRPDHSGAVGVFRDGRLVAHYAGVGADIVCEGQHARAIQVVDVMVGKEERNAVREQSPFFLAATRFLQDYIGYGNPYLLGYGFPNNRTMQLAEHLKLYAPVGSMSELTMSVTTAPCMADVRWTWRALTVENFQKYAARLDSLWRDMQESLLEAILVRRNSQRILYRYLQHPQNQYDAWLLQTLLGNVKALVVVKREAERVLLMDVLAPLDDFPEVLRLTAIEATRRFAMPLVAWVSTSRLSRVAPPQAIVKALPISTPANIWADGPKPAELQDKWWLMAGDTDFL